MTNSKLSEFDAILFDMDGVIIDTKAAVEAFWFKKMEKHGVRIDKKYVEEKLHGRPARTTIAELFPHLTEKERVEMDRECARYDSMQDSYSIIPGVEKILSELVQGSIQFGLVTSALPPKVDVMINSLSIPCPFKTIITANDVEKGKPAPECYLLGSESLGADIEKILVFEDSISGVKAAKSAGATVIGVNDPKSSSKLKQSGARFTIQDFMETTFSSESSVLHFKSKNCSYHLHSAP